MSKSEESQGAMEVHHIEVHHSDQNPITRIMDAINEHLKFSEYLISPLKYRLRIVVRIIGIIIKFCHALKDRIKGKFNNRASSTVNVNVIQFSYILNDKFKTVQVQSPTITLNEEEINRAKDYLFRRASQEVKRFTFKEIQRHHHGEGWYAHLHRTDSGHRKHLHRRTIQQHHEGPFINNILCSCN